MTDIAPWNVKFSRNCCHMMRFELNFPENFIPDFREIMKKLREYQFLTSAKITANDLSQ